MKNNHRIAWLLPVAWYYWQPVLSEFSKHFPDTKIFTGKWPGFAKGYENSLRVKQIGNTRFIKAVKGSGNGYSSGFTYMSPKIIVELLRFRPSVVFADSFRVWTVIALLLKPIFRWKVIITYEGSSPSVDYSNSNLRLLIRRMMIKSADAFMTNSKAGERYLSNILKARKDSVFVHPYQVPSAKSLLKSFPVKEPDEIQFIKPVFLFVGHIIPRKGLHCLLEACSTLQQQGYEYTLMIVGDGPDKDELEVFCKKNSLQNFVKWIGRVDYQDIGNYFAQADVFVFPTLEDTWGVSVLEAMLFAKPVLCSTGAGTSELIINGQNGYVFEPEEPNKLAQLMSNLIDNPDLISRMSIKSFEVVNKYTPETATQTLVKALAFSTNGKDK